MTPIAIVSVDSLDLLSRPRGDARVVAELPRHARLQVIERGPRWLRVRSARPALEGHADAACVALVDPEGRGFLAADPAVDRVDVEPGAGERLASANGPHEAAVARAWNLYGGLIAELSRRIAVEPAYAVAVVCVESSGLGFGTDGRVIIRFENHIFRRYLGAARQAQFTRHFQLGDGQPWLDHRFRVKPSDPWTAFHGSQALEWRAFEVARAIDADAAALSISVGLGQVMGFNHALLGYPTPHDMLAFMSADVRYQLLGLFDFVAGATRSGPAVLALRRGDFDTFASLYNGPGQARYYGELIAAHVQAFRRLKPERSTPAPPPPSPSTARTYEVRAGDTLGAIAGRLGVTVREIATLNAIANPNLIRAGQVLRVPDAPPAPPPIAVPSTPPEEVGASGDPRDTYVVQPGDSLSSIATRTRSTVRAIAGANGIANPDRIFSGQVLVIPLISAATD